MMRAISGAWMAHLVLEQAEILLPLCLLSRHGQVFPDYVNDDKRSLQWEIHKPFPKVEKSQEAPGLPAVKPALA